MGFLALRELLPVFGGFPLTQSRGKVTSKMKDSFRPIP
jgi:hypothetical protein